MDEFELSDVPLGQLLEELQNRFDHAVVTFRTEDPTTPAGYRYSVSYFGDTIICKGLISTAQHMINQDEEDARDEEDDFEYDFEPFNPSDN